MQGHNFCHSIVRAFIRLIKNIIRFSFVTLFAKLVLLMGKLGVTGAGVYVSMLCIAFIYPDPPENALPGAIPIVSRATECQLAALPLIGSGDCRLRWASRASLR